MKDSCDTVQVLLRESLKLDIEAVNSLFHTSAMI